jgi:hypothetical protein
MKTLLRFAFVYFVSTAIVFADTTITIKFDDIPSVSGPSGNFPVVTNGYNGFQWSNFYVVDALDSSIPSGGQNGTVSPKNVAFNANGNPANFSSSGAFALDSAYLTAAWNDGLQLEVQGFVGTTLTYDNTYTLNTAGPVLVNFKYLGVDEVNFISSGGTHHSGYSGAGTQFAMDNLTVTVPEPNALSLFGIGALILCWRIKPNKLLRRPPVAVAQLVRLPV